MAVTIEQIRKHDNGAQFYAADLHVHSYGASADVSDSGMTVEAIIDAAHKNGISILSITDHNTAANVERALEYGAKYAGQLLVVPGVEVTTAHGHLLVYFAPSNVAALQDFLGQVGIVGKRGSRDSHTTKSMADVIRLAEQLNGIVIAAHIDRESTGFEAREEGYPGWKGDILVCSGLFGLEFDESQNLGGRCDPWEGARTYKATEASGELFGDSRTYSPSSSPKL